MKQHQTNFLKDYTPYPFVVTALHLRVELDPERTRVVSRLSMRRNPQAVDKQAPLELNGEHFELGAVSLDGRSQPEDDYTYDGSRLVLDPGCEQFELEIETFVNPGENTALEGLYLSSGNYCTQCEAEGFRRITCYPDRPDVMTVFTTTVVGEQESCPVLLANGNLVERGELVDGRHFATWHDPFPKPCYLFALVAGKLVCLEDQYRTMSGRRIDLQIYVEERNREKCAHAMQSLKKSMRWDEQRFGLEYDLDRYMIVAVDDFNMGAMENKGLNIFNSKYVLARPETATDSDYERIEGVIGHEYFHNWTGNRVTCRDWFQLSLKEGLTVFRDQEFSSDMASRPVKRIHDVNLMRSFQFREDSGPMAHPVRPASYVEINNFYTLTVYNKGAEVIRMIHTLVGREGFRRGMDLYFARHDGRAVTCDDFVGAMEDANGIDLSQFSHWYSQAGTPEVTVSHEYDEAAGRLQLKLRQSCPATPGQPDKKPFVIPLAIGLLDGEGREMELNLEEGELSAESVLTFSEKEQRLVFTGLKEKPALSLLRNFSAPVKLHSDLDERERAFLMAHDNDPFNRWDAGQQLALQYLLEQITAFQQGVGVQVPDLFQNAFGSLLRDEQAEAALVAAALVLPSETWIGQQLEEIDPDAVFQVRHQFKNQLSVRHRSVLLDRYRSLTAEGEYRYSAEEAGRRGLRNRCLAYLLTSETGGILEQEFLDLGLDQYRQADNMTDQAAALAAVVNGDRAAGDELLADFYAVWQDDPLVVDKWLTLQATCSLPGTLKRVRELTGHASFSIRNPNKVRSLIGAFCSNQHQFHAGDGSGYRFVSERVMELNGINPMIAARLLTPLTMWKRYDSLRRQLMKKELEQIASLASLSRDVAEVVEKSLTR